ncbi:MAG: acetylornithine deacetylase [Cardiobacteriaceae bacterium]|nr:acetylornithine deacetylase [Cardiobacteriaceae bacterium]
MISNVREVLAQLVAFPSISGSDCTAMLDWVADYASPYVVQCQRLPAETGRAEALLMQVGAGNGGIVLSGHLDVVPVEGQPWESDPFVLRAADERFYGRGVCDMKGFVACALALLPQWAPSVRKPVWLALTCDEEIGCLSAPAMANALHAAGAQGAFVWVGEPTSMQVVVAHKGITNLRTVVYGRAAHSSQIGQGVSAVHVAARLVTKIEDLMGGWQAKGYVDKHFNVPFSSLHVGRIRGGAAINVMADRCFFDWEIRHLPQTDFEEIMRYFADEVRMLEADYDGVRIETTATINTVAALQDAEHGAWLDLLSCHLADTNKQYVAYATEAGAYQLAGHQTLVCGPGSIRQAHQENEWIAVTQLEQCVAVMQSVIASHCGME